MGDLLYEDGYNHPRSYHPGRGFQKLLLKPSGLRHQRLIHPVGDQTKERIICLAEDDGPRAFHVIALVLVMKLEDYHQRELVFDTVLRHHRSVGPLDRNELFGQQKPLPPVASHGTSGIALCRRDGNHGTDQYSRAVGVRLWSSQVSTAACRNEKKSVNGC